MNGFIGTSLQLLLIITAHTLNYFVTTSVPNLSLISITPWIQNQSYVTTDGQSACLSWSKAPIGGYNQIFITVKQLRVSWCGTFSLTRGRVCRLQLLLALASAVILGSETRGTRDHILLSQIRDFPFRRLLRLAELWWRYSTPPPLPFITFTRPE
jgi:hypothetical protein